MGGGYCGQDDDEQVGAQSTCKDGLLLVSEYLRLSKSSVTSHQQAIVWVTSQPVLNSHSHIKLNVAATWSSSGERDTMLYIDSGISPINSIGRVHSKVFPKNDYMCSLSLYQSLLTWWTWSRWEVCCLLYIFKTCSVGILKVEAYILANVTLQVLWYAGVKLHQSLLFGIIIFGGLKQSGNYKSILLQSFPARH